MLSWVHPAEVRHTGPAGREGCTNSDTRNMVLHRMVPKNQNHKLMFLEIEAVSCLREIHQERWGGEAPTFPDGFPGGRRPFRPQDSTTLGFDLSALFGTAPFYGHPKTHDPGKLVPPFGSRGQMPRPLSHERQFWVARRGCLRMRLGTWGKGGGGGGGPPASRAELPSPGTQT